MNEHLFVFRPGGTPLPGTNVFNDWFLLMSAMSDGVSNWITISEVGH